MHSVVKEQKVVETIRNVLQKCVHQDGQVSTVIVQGLFHYNMSSLQPSLLRTNMEHLFIILHVGYFL